MPDEHPNPEAPPVEAPPAVEAALQEPSQANGIPAAEAPPDTVPELPSAPAPNESQPEAARDGDGKPPKAPPAAQEQPTPPPQSSNKRWYVVKVQSGREESIKDAIERRVKIENLEEFFGQIIIPVDKVTEMRSGKRVVKERKRYPGYLMVEVEYNDRILYLFRETSGVGDFVGGTVHRPPPPMSDREVEAMIRSQQPGAAPTTTVAPTRPQFDVGDRVKVKDGTFAGMEGDVKEILEAKGQVKVELTIFGRGVPVELEYWQVEQV
jgi:transcription termination/antitermination protein NusG